MSLQFNDPFHAAPLVFSLPSAQWLVDTRRVQPEPQGLLGFLKPVAGGPSAVPEELAKQGFSPPSPARSREMEALLTALDVACRPQSKVVLSEVAPGAAPARYQFFLRGGQASMAWFDEAAFYVSPAVPALSLSTSLARKLVHQTPRAEPYLLLPQVLGLLTTAFRGPDGKLLRRERAPLEKALGGPAALDALVAAEVLEADGGTLQPTAGYALCLESLWSECFLRIEASFLSPQKPPVAKAFMLLGPPHRRVWSEDLVVDGKTLTSLQLLDTPGAVELAGAVLG